MAPIFKLINIPPPVTINYANIKIIADKRRSLNQGYLVN